MADVVRIGTAPAPLEVVIRRRSVQTLTAPVPADAAPLPDGAVVLLELEDPHALDGAPLTLAGTLDATSVTWQLDELSSDLPYGQRWATLVAIPTPDAGRQVWARGSAWIR